MTEPDDNVAKLTQAFTFALMTANEQPYPIAVPAVRKMAELLDKCGVVQGPVPEDVTMTLPGWIQQGVRESSIEVPERIDHTERRPTPLVRRAPKPPKRIPKTHLGRCISDG